MSNIEKATDTKIVTKADRKSGTAKITALRPSAAMMEALDAVAAMGPLAGRVRH